MSSTVISSVAALEAILGSPPLGVRMKIIDHLDQTATDWIAASPLAFVGVGRPGGPFGAVMGGERGFADVRDAGTLAIPMSAIDAIDAPEVGAGAGVLFLVPGVGETLRANGRVKEVSADHLVLAIDECFVHCAKALIRSGFWAWEDRQAPAAPVDMVNASTFVAMITMDAKGRIDISPKGDPAGSLMRLANGRAVLAERPGNRLAFGYRNIIEQPLVAGLAIIPGASSVGVLTGRASLTADEALRNEFVVQGKTPVLATLIEDMAVEVKGSRALAGLQSAGLWRVEADATGVDPAATLVAHVKLNKEQGVAATALRLAVNRGLVSGGLKENYKSQLY
jgi:predicted pyridoxine 5'-phosphate oxidase superfamily flavin-nucleotide-binding protein